MLFFNIENLLETLTFDNIVFTVTQLWLFDEYLGRMGLSLATQILEAMKRI